jgi:hypothetical protein
VSGLAIIVTDIETGEVVGEKIVPDNDYFVITTGSCTSSVQAYANGTHVVTFKGREPWAPSPSQGGGTDGC